MIQYAKNIFKKLLELINKNKYFEFKIIRKNQDPEYFIKIWEKKIPELKKFHFKKNSRNIYKIYLFYRDIIPIISKNSKNVFLRNKLSEIKFFLENKDKRKVDILTEQANFGDFVFERSTNLKSKAKQKELKKYEKSYGSKLFNNKFQYLWKNSSRNKSLLFYFKNKPSLIKNKKILHISPEKDVRDYFNLNKKKLSIEEYVTSDYEDYKKRNNDYSHNIEDIKEKSLKYDLIICHRVMEHVFNDKKAFNELMRILKKNGILNISFPETPNKRTTEWVFQDRTHNSHVRQYGYDFKNLLDKKKHIIKLDNFLLKKNVNYYFKNKIYPMRIYNIQKIKI